MMIISKDQTPSSQQHANTEMSKMCQRCHAMVSAQERPETYPCCTKKLGSLQTYCRECIKEVKCNYCTTSEHGVPDGTHGPVVK